MGIRYFIIIVLFLFQVRPAAQNINTPDFTPDDSTIYLKTVEVFGKTKSQLVKEGVFAVNAIDVTPFQNTAVGLNDMINRTTSVRIREEGGVGSDFKLLINGLSGNAIRYFIDGIPLESLGSGITLANLPTNIIQRVEIYKGVVPAHLGGDALGGAIDIITRQNIGNYLDVSYGAGSFHTHKSDLSGQYAFRSGGFIVRPVISVNSSKNDYLMRGVEMWDEEERIFKNVNLKRFHDDYFSFLGQLEAGFVNRSWADAFMLSGVFSIEDKALQTGTTQSFVYGQAHREREAWSVAAQYRKKEFFIKQLRADMSVSYTFDYATTIDTALRKYRWDGAYAETFRNEITGRGKSIREYKRPRLIARTNFNYALNPYHTININYLFQSIKNNRSDEIDREFEPSEDMLTRHIAGISYKQSFLNDRWTTDFFLKHYMNRLNVRQRDLSSKTGSEEMAGTTVTNHTGYGAGSRLTLRKAFSLKASYERSIRLPSAMEFLGNGTTVYPNFRLKPENSHNCNLGAFGVINTINQHVIVYEGGVFIRRVKDFIHRVTSEMEGLAQYENVSNVTVKGFEGEIRYDYANLIQALVNCSYQDARSMTRYYLDGSPQITYRNKIPNQPWLFSNAEINVTLKELAGKESLVRLGYHYLYTHRYFLTWEGYGMLDTKATIPTQHVHNASITFSFRKERYNISLSCNNLLDSKLYDNYMLQLPGRSFFCKFRYFIN